MNVINMLLFILFLTAFYRMETTRILLHVESVQHFDLDSVLSATKQMLPDRHFETTPIMCEALAYVFNRSEGDLHLLVQDVFLQDDRQIQSVIEDWLIHHSIMRKSYV